jgi:hypothetical protein
VKTQNQKTIVVEAMYLATDTSGQIKRKEIRPMSKNYEEQINDVQRKIKKLEAHLEYLEKLKELRDNGPSVTREKESHEVEK